MNPNIFQSIKLFFSYIYIKFWHIIAPPFCASCGLFLLEDTIFCSECSKQIVPIISTTVQITNTKEVKVFAISAYKDPLKKLILAKRYNSVASYQLGELIWQLTYIRNMPCDVLVPIPLHWTRYAWRGFNQAEHITQTLSTRSGWPMQRLLKRIRRTQPQAQLSPNERQKNVQHVFALRVKHKEFYEGKHIVLVDDLMTTSATVRAAAKELLKLKPASITVVVACRVI